MLLETNQNDIVEKNSDALKPFQLSQWATSIQFAHVTFLLLAQF